MVRSLLLTCVLILSAGVAIAQQAVLTGKVTDTNSDEALIGATVKVLKGTDFVRGSVTDTDGNYRINLDPGQYTVEISYTGYAKSVITDVRVAAAQNNFLDAPLSSSSIIDEIVVTGYKVPLIEQDKTSGGQTLTSDQIMNLPTRSVNAVVATTAGTSSIDGGGINIKGSRDNATNYYIDGIRVAGNAPPIQDIEQLQVITSGLGAEYGDVTGGVISLITKGPASEYHGAVEVESSYGLDPYGWFLANANLSGPILKRTNADGAKETVLGFRLSGQFQHQKDDDPPALPRYYVRDDVRANLEANPLSQTVSGSLFSIAENYTNDSIQKYDYNRFETRYDVDVTGKLDYRITQNMDFSVTGTYRNSENRFNPRRWQVLNAHNNPYSYDNRYRGLFRFRHRLGNNAPNENGAPQSAVSNVNYQIQLGLERGERRQEDHRHKDRIFDYGYIGGFEFDYVPFLRFNPDIAGFEHIDYSEDYTGFTPGYTNASGQQYVPNPVLLNYNNYVNTSGDQPVTPDFVTQNGLIDGSYTSIWGDMHDNVGLVYNNNSKSQSDIVTILASSGFDLKLGKTGVHSIQFGIMNEQRTQRLWQIAPSGIWVLMDQLDNAHFNGLDTNAVLRDTIIEYQPNPGSPFTLFDTASIYDVQYLDQQDRKFYKEIRESLGLSLNQYVNAKALTPDQVRLDMFSARELNDRFLLNYYGYDYLGNRLEDGVTFNDFFTSRDADGVRTFPIAPLQPLYQAAYVKDKFTFNKMIFSLGLRVERFDLNSKVLKDPYSLYDIMSADEYFATVPASGKRPEGVGDDFKVYTEGPSDLAPKAFRQGDVWYDANGIQVNDPTVIFGTGGLANALIRDTIIGDEIYDTRYDPNTSFEDYTPQVNWLPRLAFSFPISEEANFFAHYDVLVQRPPDGWQVTALDYAYFYSPGRFGGNPYPNASLRPERVVDYEVGFQQLLSQNSAIKFSAYYRELRDMIQERTYLFVPVISNYQTYGNIDFGTVKGFTVQYDLRRVKNIEFRLAYTLQFADGTGSDANSSNGLTQRGNIRTLYPLNFDERHNIQAIIDYRYGSGKFYNGPRVFGADILSNFGINIQTSAVSGRPYTSTIRADRFGGLGKTSAINGSRKPWRLNVDLRVEKTFVLTAPGKKQMNMTVYFRVQNLLDARNVINVYSYTGSPTDDGFLASPQGQNTLALLAQERRNIPAYTDAYSWRLLDPNNYTQPRRLFLGATFDF